MGGKDGELIQSVGQMVNRDIRIRLQGGFFMWVRSLYCEPKKGIFRRTRPDASRC